MKALVYHGPRDLRLEDVPEPDMDAKDVLVRVAACGICGSDLHGYLGHSRARIPPLILGHEIGGQVVAVGAEADSSLIGQTVCVRPTLSCGSCVYCTAGRDNLCQHRRLLGLNVAGGLAELVRVPVGNVVPLPQTSPRDAALVEVLANAVHVIGLVGGAESLGIAGAGGLGLLILAMACRAGIAERLLTEPNPVRRSVAESMGATVVADPREHSLSELASQLPLGGVEVAVDAVGLTQTRRDAIGAVAAGGRVVLLGLEEEDSEISFADLIRREVTLVGSFAYTAAEFHQAAEILGDLEDFLPLVETEPLERGAEVFARLADRQDQRVKIVLAP